MLRFWFFAFLLAFGSPNLGGYPASDVELLLSFHPHLQTFGIAKFQELTDIDFQHSGPLHQMNQRNSKLVYNWMFESLSPDNATHRRYFMTETIFLEDWYSWVDEAKKEKLRELISNGQLEIPNAGWVESDEAISYYDDIIEQFTVGMNFMLQTFGVVSRVAWATDAFGHSHSYAALLNELGFEMQGTERVDQMYISSHKDGPLLQFFWKAKSDSNNLTYGGILTHIRHSIHEFQEFRGGPPKDEIEGMIPVLKNQYNKNLLFRYVGTDFQEFITSEFQNLEKAMKQINEKTQCESVRYGNPTEYMERLKEYYRQNEVKTREWDLIPNEDRSSYWTGFFTTYPYLKKACRDFSRQLNFLKKDILRTYSITPGANLNQIYNTVLRFEKLNAMMQHHTGITGTSKMSVLDSMLDKMKQAEQQMNNIIQQVNAIKQTVSCDLHKHNYQCYLQNNTSDVFYLALISAGTERIERIQVVLPAQKYYKLTEGKVESYNTFCYDRSPQAECRIVIYIRLKPGTVHLKFEKEEDFRFKERAAKPFDCPDRLLTFGKSFKLTVLDKNVISYTSGDKVVNISYHFSNSTNYHKYVLHWSRFATQDFRDEEVKGGPYVMSNNGQLENYGGNVTNFFILRSDKYARVIIKFQGNIQTTITMHEDQTQVIDILTDFKIEDDQKRDFFMKVSSNVEGSNDFYHDANGYLVMRRVFNSRPDFEFSPKKQQRISANTYPATSFAYIKNNAKKMVVGVDRAEGVAIHSSNTLLLNLERITFDDDRGIGEGYSKGDPLTFRHKVGLVDANNDIERLWQKQMDQAILGYYGNTDLAAAEIQSNPRNDINKYLKLTIALLDGHTVILRLQNLAEFNNIHVQLYEKNKILLNDFGLDLDFVDIVECFHNGVPLNPTHQWIKLEAGNIVDIHKNKLENGKIELRPLQIRSFRIDMSDKIDNIAPPRPKVRDQHQLKQLTDHGFAYKKRCF